MLLAVSGPYGVGLGLSRSPRVDLGLAGHYHTPIPCVLTDTGPILSEAPSAAGPLNLAATNAPRLTNTAPVLACLGVSLPVTTLLAVKFTSKRLYAYKKLALAVIQPLSGERRREP